MKTSWTKSKHKLRYLSIGLAVIMLILLIIGIGRLTWWRPSSVLSEATDPVGKAAQQAPYVITGKNVLESTSTTVKIRAIGKPGEEVHLAVGKVGDVEAWVAPNPHLVVTDFGDGTQLTTKLVEGTKSKAEAKSSGAAKEKSGIAWQAPANQAAKNSGQVLSSDMWAASASGKGQVEITWQMRDNRWSAIAATNGKNPAPRLELSWSITPDYRGAIVLTVLSSLGLLAALILLALHEISVYRSRQARKESNASSAARRFAHEAVGKVDTVTTTTTLSRRALREMEEAGKRGELPAQLAASATETNPAAQSGDAAENSAKAEAKSGEAAPAATDDSHDPQKEA